MSPTIGALPAVIVLLSILHFTKYVPVYQARSKKTLKWIYNPQCLSNDPDQISSAGKGIIKRGDSVNKDTRLGNCVCHQEIISSCIWPEIGCKWGVYGLFFWCSQYLFFFVSILCLSCPCSVPQEADFWSILWAPLPCVLLLELTNRRPGKPSEVGNEENSGCLFSSLLPPPPRLAEVLEELQSLSL